MSDKFEYSYEPLSENERRTVEKIKKKYTYDNMIDDVKRLKKLHRCVSTYPVWLFAFLFVVGILMFGTGFSLILEWSNYFLGSIICASGIAVCIGSGFLTKWLKSLLKKKYKKEIITLCDGLLSEDTEEESDLK